ncbi:hypothetical protein, partial [Shigella sp. SHS-5]|uniref:hypothetical protein n=1 Tax=Shigella sp. SHS-5 TaxID=2116504 RepID=UPI002094A5A3
MDSSGEAPLSCSTRIGVDNKCISLVNRREPEWMRHTTEPAMTDPTRALTLQLLQSLAERPRPYAEVLET